MNTERRLQILLQKYHETDTDELRKAKRLVAERAKVQEEIKKTLKVLGRTGYKLENDDSVIEISYKITTYDRVDTDILPDEIKEQYNKVVEMWRETFNVLSKSKE